MLKIFKKKEKNAVDVYQDVTYSTHQTRFTVVLTDGRVLYRDFSAKAKSQSADPILVEIEKIFATGVMRVVDNNHIRFVNVNQIKEINYIPQVKNETVKEKV
jgi:hypothetical protein